MQNSFKKVHLIVLFLIFSSPILAQTAYYNSLKIHYYYQNIPGRNSVVDDFYKAPFDPKWTKSEIQRLVAIVDSSVKITPDGIVMKLAEDRFQSALTSGFFTIPTSTQSAIIDGTAKFLAERFREEASTLYIDKFKQKLEDIPELQILYPKTYLFLKSADIFNYTSLGNDFKEAFEEDLKNLLGNLNKLLENDSRDLKDKLLENKLYYPFSFSLALSDRLVNGDHPVEALSFLEKKYQTPNNDKGFDNYYNVVHGINIIQNSLRSVKDKDDDLYYPQFENIWLKFSNLKEIDEAKEMEIFAALIYREDTTYFKDVLNLDQASATNFFKDTVYPLAEFLNNIENFQSKEKMLAADYIEVMDNTLKLIIHFDKLSGEKISEKLYIKINNEIEEINPLEFLEKSLDLYKSIYSKNYGYVVTNGLYITDKVLLASGVDSRDVIKITQAMSKYGGFMVDVVKAEDSDDVKVLIQKNVTKFSYLDKRRSAFNITLSAHPGVYAGGEWLGKFNHNNLKASIGITAPIGFEFMWSFNRWKENKSKNRPIVVDRKNRRKWLSQGSWSFLASFADIGAAFNYRLNDSESQLPAELTFKQVFSPGISFNHGFKNSPLSLGLGYQYTPELREVKVDNIVTLKNSHRVMFRLSWDIPMIKLFNSNY